MEFSGNIVALVTPFRNGAVDDGARGEQRRQQEQARHAAAEVAEEAGRSL